MATKQCARAIYWRARPGQFEAYSDYVKAQVEPIDHEAQLRGALISHTTLIDRKPDAPWTHMRLFIFHDAEQRANMATALAEASVSLMPDAKRRAARTAHAATLRDKVGEADFDVLT